MSDNDSKTNNSTSKVKFFKLAEEKGITPAFPQEPNDIVDNNTTHHTHSELQPSPMEPSELVSRELETELGNLKPQVESISQLPQAESLSGDQVDVLKRYISLKESEVRDLREQLRQYQAFVIKVSGQLENSLQRSRDLLSELDSVKRKEEVLRAETSELKQRYQEEITRLRNDYEEKLRRFSSLESQDQQWKRQRNEWQEKIKEDLKRIKLKERELENKYELFRRDTQVLLDSKDKHVLELKQKNDALELEMENLEERIRHSNSLISEVSSKKTRLIEALKLAVVMLEEIDSAPIAEPKKDRKAG